MKAIVYARFGSPDVLRLQEVERPVPGDGEILIRVRAASLNAYDWRHLRAGRVRSIIDRSFPLERTAEALRYLEEGCARGKIVITV